MANDLLRRSDLTAHAPGACIDYLVAICLHCYTDSSTSLRSLLQYLLMLEDGFTED